MARTSATESKRWVTEVITAARSPWQNAYVERVIVSIRRECLDHIERHLRRVLSSYVDYYQRTRTHLSLDKDCPDSRPIMPRRIGKVVAIPKVGGLHHRYERLGRLTRTIPCSPMLRGRRYASSEVSRSGFFDLDNGAEHLCFRSLPIHFSAPISLANPPPAQLGVPMEFLVGTGLSNGTGGSNSLLSATVHDQLQ